MRLGATLKFGEVSLWLAFGVERRNSNAMNILKTYLADSAPSYGRFF